MEGFGLARLGQSHVSTVLVGIVGKISTSLISPSLSKSQGRSLESVNVPPTVLSGTATPPKSVSNQSQTKS